MRISEKEQKQKLNIFFIVEFLACAVMVLCTTRQLGSIASAAFTGSFLLLVAWFAKMVLLDGNNHHLALTFVIVMESVVAVVVSALLNEESITMAYLTELFVFLSTILFLFVIMNTEANEKTCRAILTINVFVGYIYIIAYRFFPQERRFGMVDLNFSNPNLAAMWLLQAVLYATIAAIVLKPVFLRLLALVSIPINIWLILQTESRNCLLALVLFGAMCGWVVLKGSAHFAKPILIGINIVPSVFVPAYLAYAELVLKKGWFEFLNKEGKSLLSRVGIWENRFEAIEGVWLIGNYAQVSGNSHNDHMVLLCSFGLFGLVLVVWYLCSLCIEINQKATSRKNLYALAAFFSVVFMGLGEGGLYSGGLGIFVMACGVLYLAKCDFGADTAQALPWQRKKQE